MVLERLELHEILSKIGYLEVCTVHSKDMQLFLNSLMLNFLTPIGLKNFIPTNEDPLSPNIMVLERLEYMKYRQKSDISKCVQFTQRTCSCSLIL